MSVHRVDLEFNYKGRIISARQDMFFIDGKRVKDKLIFRYNDINVSVSFDSDIDITERVGENECSIIDKLGKEDYKTLENFRERIRGIEKSHVVINNKVYNYQHDNSTGYHIMVLPMQDGTRILGDSPIEYINNLVRKDKQKTFENLVYNVKRYHKETGIEPDEMAVDEKLTLEYMEIQIWINRKIKE
ncbi:hypothetical protein CN567_22185 [Bacillus toyonensis]|uniref:Uncharacterized protein n=2 Tax=Bacillus toyonensis TaxID=155322 RepID=A0AB36T8Z8_9BACI|nr:hypothetical protein [Bacillus toyonensis]PEC09876.1 hypothetical protein CON55_16015 [Bacillus toyonensis]PEN90168.1 hypothetical protein CN551_07485 [Bacillus toyonensis]PEO60912.1 hypothetical protein CN567_22185 [Bacillus toyonensis]PFX69997.1 hypothetical protein COL37_30235 [Bacillus toyonensis]PFX78934.1 hypothetical protein COL38_21190 [Bacillus toyonensis]